MVTGTSIGKIKLTGIPIDANFEKKCDRKLLFGKYHLDINKPVILIAAGAFGVLKNIEDTVTKLKNIKDNQIIVACGNNWKLEEKLVIQSLGEVNVRILGYSNQMDELMKMATVVVMKAGGITLSEALSIQVPLILYRSVPGQEEENTVFFEKNGAAIIAEKPNDLIENIFNLIQNENIRMNINRNMKKLYHTNAAEVICKDIITMLQVQVEKENLNKVIL